MKSAKPYLPYLIVSLMVLFSGIPLGALEFIILERQSYKRQVENEITSQWGDPLSFGAIKLKVPYRYKTKVTKNIRVGKDEYKEVVKEVLNSDTHYFAMSKLFVDTKVKVEKRYKGIYEVPIYQSHLLADIVFNPIKKEAFGDKFVDIKQNEVEIDLGLKAGKEINNLEVLVDKKPVEVSSFDQRLTFKVPSYNLNKKISIQITLDYSGTKDLKFIPSAIQSEFNLKSNWADPKFIGDRLPSAREITKSGFSSSWKIQNFGSKHNKFQEQNWFGVSLFNVLDIYHLNERTIKYGRLFIFITVFSLFLIQYIQGKKTHPIQYGLIILSMVEFFFIMLSFSEHLSYGVSYFIASTATILTLGLYAKNIFRDKRIAFAISSELVLLYSFLYFTVDSKDYALLIGSIGLFVIIGASMFFTRKVDWSMLDQKLSQTP